MDTNTVKAHVVAADTRGRRISPRQHRSIEQKRALVIESQQPGASVAEIARRNGVNANLLFVWRRQHEQGVLETRTRRMSGRRPGAGEVAGTGDGHIGAEVCTARAVFLRH